ncbi:MAG: hypothetical protein AAGU32_19775, partial [Bacillota bacterium]
MPQDNQNNKVQFCRELGAIFYRILSSSNELFSTIEELLDLYRPKSQEESGRFCGLRFDLPDSERLLCDLRKIDMPDDNEFYNSVAPLNDMALDVVNRMVCVNVIITDI